MPESPAPDDSLALKLFSRYLDQGSLEDLQAWEALCSQHQELRDQLEALRSQWESVEFLCQQFDSTEDRQSDLPDRQLEEHVQVRLQQLRAAGVDRKYVRREAIGQGGMAQVFRAWDTRLHRELAVKVVRETATNSDMVGRLARFLSEAHVTARLEHPGIVPTYDLGHGEDGLFFTMRLVRGRTLREVARLARRKEQGWTLTRALQVVLKVCETMAYAHGRGVVHRDLKPANVMVGEFGQVYVVDWGLALGRSQESGGAAASDAADSAALPTISHEGMVLGTPSYMAPEQARGESRGPLLDVYALGCILYELLTGFPPYLTGVKVKSAQQVHEELLEGPPTAVLRLNPKVPEELIAICNKAMQRDPSNRYGSAEVLAADLQAFLDTRVVRAFESGALAQLRKWFLRNRWAALAGVGAALVLLGLLVTHLVLQHQSNRLLAGAKLAETAAAEHAVQERQRAVAAREDVLRLADTRHLRLLRQEADQLWPPHPERIQSLEESLARARELEARLPLHEAALGKLQARENPGETLGTEAAWWSATLSDLVADLRSLPALTTSLQDRLQRSQTIQHRSIADYRNEWDAVLADLRKNPHYGGLPMQPQLGLVPLGADETSGLYEFWVIDSGARPLRAADSGEWQITAGTGLILVLIPGGRFLMGSQNDRPAAANYHRPAMADEIPPVEIELAPFFLSKYEMTQGQWLRITGHNPSRFDADHEMTGENFAIHPVEQIDWFQCRKALRTLGLVLPTEARWEYACRAGTVSPWWCGDSLELVAQGANLADLTAKADRFVSSIRPHSWDDGHAGHAPVGSFAANPFGLFDIMGNVSEWCLDLYQRTPPRARTGDGLRGPDPNLGTGARVERGGGFTAMANTARSANRQVAPPERRHGSLGVRPARLLDL
jgi:serine/threonine protein kinase/formylglycine-generating enzyme required for sulfatase activity